MLSSEKAKMTCFILLPQAVKASKMLRALPASAARLRYSEDCNLRLLGQGDTHRNHITLGFAPHMPKQLLQEVHLSHAHTSGEAELHAYMLFLMLFPISCQALAGKILARAST